MKQTFLLILWLAAAAAGHAQGNSNQRYVTNQNAWFMYFGDHKFSEKWGVHLEAQLRRSDWLSAPQQVLLRTGLNYHFNSQVFATAGYCYVVTSPYGDLPAAATFPENRIWEQVQAKAQYGRIEWVNRLRLEQRFVNAPAPVTGSPGVFEPGDAVYTNRFRLFNRISIPFKGKSITDGSLYLTLYDEVFFNFGKQVAVNALDQNRAYAALGYKIPNLGRLELGYLYQTLYKSDGIKIERNHTLQVGLISNIDFFKEG
ncbi:MAG: DUF2490 domain-containing protein [Saprospiraceae bacterium]|nr:DUF2490 domain-containing protein [Saprospiraceae bacterium]